MGALISSHSQGRQGRHCPLQVGWRFWVDRGGTFTDLVALPPHGPLVDGYAACHTQFLPFCF